MTGPCQRDQRIGKLARGFVVTEQQGHFRLLFNRAHLMLRVARLPGELYNLLPCCARRFDRMQGLHQVRFGRGQDEIRFKTAEGAAQHTRELKELPGGYGEFLSAGRSFGFCLDARARIFRMNDADR